MNLSSIMSSISFFYVMVHMFRAKIDFIMEKEVGELRLMMQKLFSSIKKQCIKTYEYDTNATKSFVLVAWVMTTIFALIAISGRPSGATFIHLSLDYVVAFILNLFLFVIVTFLLAFILSLLRIPIARIALSSILYVGIGFGVLLYVVDAGTIFSIIIGVFSSILATVLSFFVHQIRAYKYGKKILLFSAIGLTIISIALFMSNQSNVDDPLTGPYDVQFFTYGSGKDPYRKDFGNEVTEHTETVDASSFITNWSAKRTKFWDFDQHEFPINGRVFMPVGEGPFPVILTVHGNHTMEKFSTGGYDYLGEIIASHGFIFISVDEDFINYSNITGQPNDNYLLRTWILLQHIVQLKEMNQKEDSLFYQKVNLQEIALSGHSRGGQAAAMGADYERFIEDPALLSALQDVEIKAVAAISPTDKSIDHTKPKLENVSYFIMHGAQDADVYNFRGDHQFYRTALTDANQIKATLYIEHANHVQFNNDWGRYDLAMPKGLFLNQMNLLSKKEQQQIAATYLTAFYKDVFQQSTELATLIENEQVRKELLPDTTMAHKYETGQYQSLLTYNKHQEILGQFSNATKKEVIRPKNRSGGIHPQDALHITWEEEATYLIPISLKGKNIDRNSLVLTIANYKPKAKIDMEVVLSNENNTLVQETHTLSPVIEIDQTPFGLLDTYYRDGKYDTNWEPIFETIHVPLTDISAETLKDTTLTLQFSGTNGEILLEEIGIE